MVVVHLGGWPADMVKIKKLAKKYKLYFDRGLFSQAHGAQIINRGKISVGSFGDISTWSFCQDKIMTTGGEGVYGYDKLKAILEIYVVL